MSSTGWTRDKPTEAGYWWFCFPGARGGVGLLKVIESSIHKGKLRVAADTPDATVEGWHGWWLGPLEPPAPPKEAHDV